MSSSKFALFVDLENCGAKVDTLLSVLEKNYNVTPLHAIRSFECCMADTEEQLTELKVRQNHPMLSFTSLVLNDKNEPIEYCNAIINGKYTVIE